MPKTKRAKSVLRRQKPRRSKGGQGWRKRAAIAALVVTGAVGVALVARRAWTAAFRAAPAEPIDWKVTFRVDGDHAVPDAAAEKIVAIVRKQLGAGDPESLRRTARAVQQAESYASVHLLRLGMSEVAVALMPRIPALCVAADHLRFISTDGDVYGQPDGPNDCPGPVVSGIFAPERTRYALGDDFALELTQDERTAVREAIALRSAASSRKLTLKTIEHRPYRGFFVTLDGRDTEIAVGRAPFEAKLARLVEILGRLAQSKEDAARIELDYQGKAFIKVKKM
jgi:hypothetical protein